MSELQFEGRYIEFHWAGYSKSGTTETWRVMTKDVNPVLLGVIKWYGPWRCYALTLDSSDGEYVLVFEKQCLRDIANFCEKVTIMQREKRLGISARQAPRKEEVKP